MARRRRRVGSWGKTEEEALERYGRSRAAAHGYHGPASWPTTPKANLHVAHGPQPPGLRDGAFTSVRPARGFRLHPTWQRPPFVRSRSPLFGREPGGASLTALPTAYSPQGGGSVRFDVRKRSGIYFRAARPMPGSSSQENNGVENTE